MIKSRYVNEEQRNQIEIHKYLTSMAEKRDRGEDACIEWVNNYAEAFRAWAETVPEKCISCGFCLGVKGECPHPFNKKRIDMIEKDKPQIDTAK